MKSGLVFGVAAAMGIIGSQIWAEPVALTAEDFRNGVQYGIEARLDRDQGDNSAPGPVSNLSSVALTAPNIVATFESAASWASGVNWGGETYGGSIGKGVDFFGSNLAETDYVSIEIRFSSTDSTLCQTFVRPGYASGGVGVFPGTAWDVSNPGSPRRLNICFVENTADAPNLLWDPNNIGYGKREYLYIMNSDYDGTGTTYAGFNGSSGASSMPILYNWWPMITSGMTLLQTLPATMYIDAYYVKNFRGIPDTNKIILTWRWYSGGQSGFDVYSGSDPDPDSMTLLHSTGAGELFYNHTGLTNGTEYFYRIDAVDGGASVIGTSPTIGITAQSVSSNLDLVGYWNDRGRYGDIWGYTDTGGNEYALLCARDEGVSIIDIGVDPPVEVGFIPILSPGNDAKDVKIYQNYAIIVKEYEDIQIVDITDVTNPLPVSTWSPDGGGAHNCLVDGDYLYVIGNHGAGGLEIVDISNPASPFEVGNFQPVYYHDIDIRNDTIVATGIFGNGIDLIDVTNKAFPSLVANFNYSSSGAHNVEFSADGSHVFQGDEIGGSGKHTRVWDISDLGNITLASEIIVDPSAATHNSYLMEDTLLVIAHYTEGVRIWNVKNPDSPFEVAYYDTYQPAEYGYRGCWSVYPYFASGKIIASDMQTGLYVFEPDFPPPSTCCDMPGDVNNDDQVDIADLTYYVAFMFGGGPPPVCLAEADLNSDCSNDIADLTFRVAYMFSGGAPPVCGCAVMQGMQ